MSDRMSTGIPGLDEIFNGGLVAQRTYLLVGAAGTGKTILSLQWLLQGQKNKKPLYITLAEPGIDIERNVSGFGWKLDKINLLDLSPKINGGKRVYSSPIEEYHVFSPSEVEQPDTWKLLYKNIEKIKPERLVIDSVTQLRYLSTDEYQFRKQMLNLVSFLNQHKITTFLLFEPMELEREASIALAVDGIVKISSNVSQSRDIAHRCIEITKLRGSDFLSGYHPFSIKHDGIHIYPHRIEKMTEINVKQHMIKSNIPNLDMLLAGGIESGTTTIISGPTGVGKSSLGIQFLISSCSKNNRAIIYTFEEPANFIIKRCAAIGMPITKKTNEGSLKIVRINPMEIYLDEFLQMIHQAVEIDKFNLIMIDSLGGYHLAMEQYGTFISHIQNLKIYLNQQNITAFLINEVEEITGNLKVTELGVSHLSDNIILLRYAEYNSQVIKVIACLKKRLGNFQPELRGFAITSEGLTVGEKLENLRGILTGIPTSL
ncbi:MAG: ATPase domain-containing protein [Legionellaceae bacterium]|nr:ATPase domain-containing protein [Legionellaceae bacterium]